MRVKHSKPKGKRILKSTHKHRPLWIEPEDSNWWFSHNTNEWIRGIENTDGAISSAYYGIEDSNGKSKDVWSLKAAIRKIRKWNVPKDTVFNVSTPYVGYDFKITKQ